MKNKNKPPRLRFEERAVIDACLTCTVPASKCKGHCTVKELRRMSAEKNIEKKKAHGE